MLAAVQFTPLFGAVLICWIFSVCVHEFSHAVVAYWGGDTSVKEKGYLGFDPLSYIHPVTSLLVPAVFLIMGGLPLPGGAVYINTAALHNKHWSALVSAAGPASNFILFCVLAVVLHPAVGIVDPTLAVQPTWVQCLGAVAVLQLMSVFFNLIPLPPLDGFGILEPYLDEQARDMARRMGWGGLIVLFVVFGQFEGTVKGLQSLCDVIITRFGLPWEVTWRSFNLAMFGQSD